MTILEPIEAGMDEAPASSAAPPPESPAPRYGKAGIPETWLVDPAAETVTVLTGPGRDGYAHRQVRRRGDAITATAVPELTVQVAALFP